MTETSNHASPTTTAATTTGGKTLALLGIATCCMGAGIAALPHVSYTAAQLVSGLGIHGVIGASVFTGGALLVALGRTRKSLEDAQANSASNANTTLLLEQLATDLAQTRATLEMVQAQAAENTHCVQALRAELANSHTGTDHSGPSTEALFQLASGLDKLGARIDQKLKVHHSSLHDSLEELGATLAHTRRTLEERMATLETSGTIGVHATGINTTGATCMTGGTTPAATLAATNDGSTLELADNGWNPSEWNTPQVEGTATSGAIGELQTWGESEIGGPIGSLGLLDNFEDTHVAPALPQFESTTCDTQCDATLDFDALDANSGELARELDRASRACQQLEDTRSTTTSDVDVNTVPGVADLANKLQALQALLAD
ncbi:MAG: hypothetical protein ACKPBA_01830, partial [Planctomycetota bacterium]